MFFSFAGLRVCYRAIPLSNINIAYIEHPKHCMYALRAGLGKPILDYSEFEIAHNVCESAQQEWNRRRTCLDMKWLHKWIVFSITSSFVKFEIITNNINGTPFSLPFGTKRC